MAAPGSSSYAPVFSTQHSKTTARKVRENQNSSGSDRGRFCDLHAAWRGRLSPTMRQTHPAGERLFVDYAGQTADVIDGATDEVRRAQIFVAVLGASNFTYAELGGPSHCRTGSAAMSARSPAWAGWPGRSCATTSRTASQRPAATSPASAEPTRTWQPTTARRSCQPGCASRVTRPRSRWPSSRPTLGSGPAAQSPVPLPGGAERRDPRADHRPEQPPDAPPRH